MSEFLMLIKPFRIKQAQRFLKADDIRILDVGSGSHSASITKKWLPKCHYTGIDIAKNFGNDEVDFKAMDEFIEMDLTKLEFNAIPENRYDLIIMSHVIEHLHNGDKVIQCLVSKLKKDGIFYIEFPSERSVNFPSVRETLNFYDDPTHCRIYTVKEVSDLLVEKGLNIVSAGTRRQLINILVMPIKIIIQLLTKGYVR
ncbi:MAG: class I SAM-dependent methyltransferase, partial [Bacteroidetes bacterium]